MARKKSTNPEYQNSQAKVNYMIPQATKDFLSLIAMNLNVTESDLHRHILGCVMVEHFDSLFKITPELAAGTDPEMLRISIRQDMALSLLNPKLPMPKKVTTDYWSKS